MQGTASCRAAGGPRALWGLLAGLAFPAALLLFSTFFLGGRTGFWSDDYWHNLRDPASGALPPLTWSGLTMERGFFLRPLFYKIVPPLTTLAWNAQWPAHLAQTLGHGLVVVLLWVLMRTLGIPRRVGAAAALLFMVYPAHFEAVLWVAALPTVIATALMLGMMILTARLARRPQGERAPRVFWTLVVMPLYTFLICCLNEQPAMGVLALPLAYWAALAATPERPALPARTHLLRALLPALLCGLAVLLYAYLVISDPDKPAGTRGSPDQFVALGQLPARTAHLAGGIRDGLLLRGFWLGALETGWAEFRGAGWLALACGAALAASAALWLLRRRGVTHEPSPNPPIRTTPLILLGATIFATGWLPILAMAAYEPDPRTRYWPAIGLALILGAIGASATRPLPRRGRLALGAALVPVLLVFSLMLVGVQSAFRDRWRLDHRQGEELRSLVPEPAPLTFFVALDIRTTGISTGSPALDRHFRSVWEFPWATPKFIKTLYSSDEVRCGYWREWTPGRPVAGADETGLHYTDRLGPAFPGSEENGWRVPWGRAVPFVIDEEGHVRLVTKIAIDGPSGTAEVPVPQARRAVERGLAPERTAHLPRS